MATSPPTKRAKKDPKPQKLIRDAWDCYRNYIEYKEHIAEGGGDAKNSANEEDEDEIESNVIDELIELTEILEPLKVAPFNIALDDSNITKSLNIKSLLSILMSMSYVHLANYAISHVMEQKDFNIGFDSPTDYFEHALRLWPSNPAAISVYAYFDRMFASSCAKDICERYCKAAEFAKTWRKIALDFLEGSEDVPKSDVKGMNVKEWVEMLIVNGALGMDFIPYEKKDEKNEAGSESGEYSYSEIEATAAFMAALLLSTLGKHEEALQHLKKFNLSHRIHPNVWKMAQSSKSEISDEVASKEDTSNDVMFEPKIYHCGSNASTETVEHYYPNGILPPKLYKRICELFGPRSNYWIESDYSHRRYYSYFIDLDDASRGKSIREQPTNVVEDVIVNYLLPLAERTLYEKQTEEEGSRSDTPRIVGAEWWCHTRQLGANLGHQIHFDTDEYLLAKEKKVTHPIVSSVLYLTGGKESTDGSKAGATIVFNQTPDSKDVASKAWVCHPKDNTFMNFPGNLLHGVLPCTGGIGDKDPPSDDVVEGNNRLTFMVGFWTRNVAEGMRERKLYGPCGPMPPPMEDHSWVNESQVGYTRKCKDDADKEPQAGVESEALPFTSPAWEEFAKPDVKETESSSEAPVLVVPKGLDHRYFVLNAPSCFGDSLFKKEDCF